MRTMKDSSPKRQWPEEETAVRIVAVDIPFDQLARLFLKAILAMLVAVISLAYPGLMHRLFKSGYAGR